MYSQILTIITDTMLIIHFTAPDKYSFDLQTDNKTNDD